jgi:hypothetical protein
MAGLDDDRLELIERQLADRVTERVRSSLFRLYASVGVAVITVIGFVSWDIVGDIKSGIIEAIDKDIETQRAEIAERVTETRIIAKRANEVIQRVEKQLDEFEPQAQDLDETIQKVKALNVTSQDLIAAYSREIQPLVSNVESLSQRFVALAKQVDELNTLASDSGLKTEVGIEKTTLERSAAIQSVISQSKEAEKILVQARQKTTVFFQFAGGRREQAEALSAALVAEGYIVPGEDREGGAAGKHEVRYFNDDDEVTAQRLAEDTTRALRSLGYEASEPPDIVVKSLVNYPGKKPRLGVLELWVEIPAR